MDSLMFDKYSKLPKEIQTQVMDYIEFLVKKYEGNFQESLIEEKKSNFGSAKGLIVMSDDFELPIDDFKEYR